MPKANKRTRQSQDAIKKHWKQVENLEEMPLELSDAELDTDKLNESWFNSF